MAKTQPMVGIIIRGNGERWNTLPTVDVWSNGVDHGVFLRFAGGVVLCRCGVTGCAAAGNKATRTHRTHIG